MKVQSDWREGPLQRKEEWKFVFTSSGVLCVITRGERLMPLWCVSKWATQNSVSWYLTKEYSMSSKIISPSVLMQTCPKKSIISILGRRKVILYTVGLVLNVFECKCAFNNCIIACV